MATKRGPSTNNEALVALVSSHGVLSFPLFISYS